MSVSGAVAPDAGDVSGAGVSPDPGVAAAVSRGNPVCFLEISVGTTRVGRIKLELFKDRAPRTCENFRQLACGEYRPKLFPLGYKGTTFHRVIKGFMIQGGDFVKGDGSGSESIYGTRFPDETFAVKHDQPGLLSMANNGKDTNGCQFFITCGPAPWLDDKHVCFGKVLDDESMKVVRAVEACRVSSSRKKPEIDITITECGEL